MKRALTRENIANLLVLICSLIFLTSGLSKIFAMSFFSEIIKSFRIPSFTFIAPLISVIEIWLALALITKFYIKIHIAFCIFLLILFTIIFALGHLVLGINDCGCFGKIGFLRFSPPIIFLRNIVLIFILIFCYFNTHNSITNKLKSTLLIITICVIYLIANFAFFNNITIYNHINSYPYEFYKYDQQLTLNNDSTYLLFFYNPNCPKCINATENIKSFLEIGKVQKILGITPSTRKAAIPEYVRKLNPNFNTIFVERDHFSHVIKELPYAIIVKEGMVIWSCTGNECNISPYLINTNDN